MFLFPVLLLAGTISVGDVQCLPGTLFRKSHRCVCTKGHKKFVFGERFFCGRYPNPDLDCPVLNKRFCRSWDGCMRHKKKISCNQLGLYYFYGDQVKRDYQKAKRAYRTACSLGFVNGCNNVAWLHETGLGTPLAPKKARALYRKNAKVSGWASYRLGRLYEKGLGGEQSFQKAKHLYAHACKRHEAHGCASLGSFHERGLGGRVRWKAARTYYTKACRYRSGFACDRLGWFREKGLGVPIQLSKARTLYTAACLFGYGASCKRMGDFYQRGTGGVKKDRAKAKFFYRKAHALHTHHCKRQNGTHCLLLGDLYFYGYGVKKDQKRAHSLYQTSCLLKEADGCASLAELYASGQGVRTNYKKAKHLFGWACQHHSGYACFGLGKLYEHGHGVAMSKQKAFSHYTRACQKYQFDGGCYRAGWLSERGMLMDYGRARILYQRACQYESKRACHRLGDIFAGGLGLSRSVRSARRYYQRACQLGEDLSCRRLKVLLSKQKNPSSKPIH